MGATAIQPVPVTVIGTGDGATVPANGVVAVTPDAQPNLVVVRVNPVIAMLIRFANVYLGMVVGLIGVALVNKDAIPAVDFLHLVWKCMNLSLSGALLLSLKDVLTILRGWERKYPLLTGSV